MKTPETLDNCSFCGKHKDSVAKLIVGSEVSICNECVDLCQTLLKEELPVKAKDSTLGPVCYWTKSCQDGVERGHCQSLQTYCQC
jgi:hypothetical protein